MAFIFQTRNGLVQDFNGEEWKARQVNSGYTNFDGWVNLDVLFKDDVLDAQGLSGEALPREREVFRHTDGKLYLTNGARTDTYGSVVTPVDEADAETAVVYGRRSVNQIGQANVAKGVNLVSGPEGFLVEYQSGATVLANAVASLVADDFVNTVWDALGERVNFRMSADDASSRGMKIDLDMLDVDGNLVQETVYTDGIDSSIEKQTVADNIVAILGFAIDKTVAAGNLIFEDVDNNACVNLATPAAGSFGRIATATQDAKGTGVKIVAGSAQTGTCRLIGKDKDGAVISELLSFVATDTVYSALAYAEIDYLQCGDDGVATQDYTISVEANSAGQIVGSTKFAGANALESVMIQRA